MLFVFNGVEEEAAGRSGGSGFGAIMCGEDGGDGIEAHVAASDIENGADEIADHVVKKPVAANAIDEELKAVGCLFVPGGGVDGANGGANLWSD